MVELKTLKDIEDQIVIFGNPIKCVLTKDLRQEAINCVKHWLGVVGNPEFSIDENNCIGFKTGDMDRMIVNKREACGSIGSFVNFFNITEEELNDRFEVDQV